MNALVDAFKAVERVLKGKELRLFLYTEDGAILTRAPLYRAAPDTMISKEPSAILAGGVPHHFKVFEGANFLGSGLVGVDLHMYHRRVQVGDTLSIASLRVRP